MCGLLRSLGYSTLSFASGADFLRSTERCRVSCVITDVHMPGMSGLELQRALIADDSHIPVVLITAVPDDLVRRTAMAQGAAGFLIKPFEMHDLLAVLPHASA